MHPPSGRSIGLAFAAAAALSGCAGGAAPGADDFELTRTDSGLAHITAASLRAAAAGVGYGYASDNFCLLQDYVLTVNGERSKYLGADGQVAVEQTRRFVSNFESDVFYRFYIGGNLAEQLYATADADTRDMVAGYVAGINRYLRETAAGKVDAACRGRPWLRDLTPADGYRLLMDKAILGSGSNFIQPVANAKPPAASTAQAQPDARRIAQLTRRELGLPEELVASNGWAFGRDAAEGAQAVLLGNPHFPWDSANRFWSLRMTVPGRIDVTGATLGGYPMVAIGYNKQFAWTHTVSTGRRFTLYELALKPGQPTVYVVDGVEKAMQPVDVSVEVKADAGTQVRTTRLWRTDFGPVLSLPSAGLGWSAQRAYAIADVNLGNNRMVASWLDLGTSSSVREARDRLSRRLGIPWVNTLAADSTGEVMYADISPIPNVDGAMLARCAPSPAAAALLKAASLVVLDGSRAECRWPTDAQSPVPGTLAPAQLASAVRTDFVANQNDSYWLANTAIAWPANLSPLLGPAGTPQRMRTRAQLELFARRFEGSDGLPGRRMSAQAVQQLWGRHDNYAASLVLDDLARLCATDTQVTLQSGEAVPLASACRVLAAWDRRSDVHSRGAHLFREFWRLASAIPGVHAVPFTPADPARTPRGLNVADAGVRQKVLQALGQAVQLLERAGVALDAPLGDVQYASVGTHRYPLGGGDEFEGVLDKLEFRGLQGDHYEPFYGSSWVQLVSLTPAGATAQGWLTYSQSTDPASPWFGNQLPAYSAQRWLDLPPMPR